MYREYFRQRVRKGQFDFSIMYDPAEVLPWTIQYAGNGHYFDALTDCVGYALKRKWIRPDEVESIVRTIITRVI